MEKKNRTTCSGRNGDERLNRNETLLNVKYRSASVSSPSKRRQDEHASRVCVESRAP